MNTSHKPVRFVDLGRQYQALKDDILAAVDRISATGNYILGDDVRLFEEEFAAYIGTRHAVAVGNGSDALYLILRALGIGPGDEVITAPNSFVASAWVIHHTGARIVFADVDQDMNLDPAAVAKAITPRTKAIMPVHLTGRVADMDALNQFGVTVVEDAAQAVGASYRGHKAGTFGVAAGFSLHPLKNLHVPGDGGIITTDDGDLAAFLRKQRNHGLNDQGECEAWGINSRLDSIWAAVARTKLRHLDAWNDRFRALAGLYRRELEDLVRVPTEYEHERQVYHRFVIRHPRRDELRAFLAERGVETRVNYAVPLHLQPAAASLGYTRGSFPVTEELADQIVSLPIYAEMDLEDAERVIACIKEFSIA